MTTRISNFQQIQVRSPTSSHYGYRSADRFASGPGRSVPSTNPLELPPIDAQARYSISYVPSMSEHVYVILLSFFPFTNYLFRVNTGATLLEAQLKVVLLTCEVERLNTLNYNLVKENEVLKVQNTNNGRQKDLETKLAIVLAENEKLIQVVEELHEVFTRSKGVLVGLSVGESGSEQPPP